MPGAVSGVTGEVDEQTSEAPAFEDKLGNHGGLGGWQREPFVMFPSEFTPEVEEIIGADIFAKPPG